MITNPEDTGIFNPHIDEIVEIVHEAGGLCHYDQANANGILGITRARDAGFDLCQFNLHKTFSSPHCSMGMPVGASGVTAELAPFLPRADGGVRRRRGTASTYDRPRVDRQGARLPRRSGDGRALATRGCWRSAPRACARWPRSAVLNNNYLAKRLAGVPRPRGVATRTATRARRLEQIRYIVARSCARTPASTRSTSRGARPTSASRSTSRATSRGSSPSR